MTALDKSNPDFEEYYKAQNIVPEGEWDEFIASLRKPLPVTFRINGSGKFADHLRDKLQSDFFSHFSDGTLQVWVALGFLCGPHAGRGGHVCQRDA